MNKNKIIAIAIVIAVVFMISLILAYYNSESSLSQKPDNINEFSYSDSGKIKQALGAKNIMMSNPTKITDYTKQQYCMYFEQDLKKIMDYCITTALADVNGVAIGNINMGGSEKKPEMALAIIEIPKTNTRHDNAYAVIETMIESLVCNCWESVRPGGFESVQQWLNITEQKYQDSSRSTIKSMISGLEEKDLILEITDSEHSYLWTLIVIQ